MRHLILATICLIAFTVSAQDYSSDAQKYFSSTHTVQEMYDLIKKSLPTVEDCKYVFKNEHAYTYFGVLQEVKKNLDTPSENTTRYNSCKISSFSTDDIVLQRKNNYAGGMKNITDKLQTNVLFYSVTLLKEAGNESGNSFNYWVNIKGRWVFFPKPWKYLPRSTTK